MNQPLGAKDFRLNCAWIFAAFLLGTSASLLGGQTNDIVYSNNLVNGWADWSWASDNLTNTNPVLPGYTNSIAVNCEAYTALALHQTNFSPAPYANLTLWLDGGASGGQALTVFGTTNWDSLVGYELPPLTANAWAQFTIPLAALGVTNQSDFNGIWIFNENDETIPTFYVDAIQLNAVSAPAQAPTPTFVKGCDLAWENGAYNTWLGLDPFEPGWGIDYDSDDLNAYMGSMQSMGITVLRVWINEGDMGDEVNAEDYVTNVTPAWHSNFANMMQLAVNHNIQLYVTLNNGRSDWLENPAQAGAYLTNALIPLVKTYKGNTNIWAFDLMNEIDGVVQGPLGNYTSSGATWPQAQAYISNFAAAVHAADPARKVSCSTGWHQWYNLSYFLGLGLDFYDYHNYQDTPQFPTAASLGMDKPIYIGECGQATDAWSDSIQSMCELDALNSAFEGGYMGLGIWDYSYPGSDDMFSMVNTNGSWRAVDYTIQNWGTGVYGYTTNISLRRGGTNLILAWPPGILLQSTHANGPWTTNTAALSPMTFSPANPHLFYLWKAQASP